MDLIKSHSSVVIPNPSDFFIAIAFAFGFVVARSFLHRFIFSKIASWLLSSKGGQLKMNEASKAKIAKCSESMWKLAYYAIVEFCVLKYTYHEQWFSDIKGYFEGWPNDQELTIPLQMVYMCQCGFYLYSIVALLTWETRRKDFYVMMSHHVITVFLIACSYTARLFRGGPILLALHDPSDIFMEAAKIFRYSDNDIGAIVFFGMFAISWVILRLIIFPFWFIRATSYDMLEYLNMSNKYDMSLYYILNTLLLTILLEDLQLISRTVRNPSTGLGKPSTGLCQYVTLQVTQQFCRQSSNPLTAYVNPSTAVMLCRTLRRNKDEEKTKNSY